MGRREVRISLRTKDRATAKILVAQRALAMTKRFQDPEPWDRDAEERLESYQRGLTLIERYGLIDLGDTFAIDDLREWLTLEEFRDYVFAAEHKAALAAKTLAPPRASGSPDAIPTEHPQRPTQANQAPQRASAPSHVGDELIDRAIDRFVASKKLATTDATADKYGAQCRLFLKIIASGRTNLMISNITAKDLRTYVDTLPHLPARVDSADPRPLEQIMRGAGPTLSAKTVFSHAQATNMFLAWCEAQQYAVQSNFRSILKPLLKKPKVKNKTKAFSQQQLRALFETDSYQQGLFKRASDYWVPLLGLFTGAREAELCQLDVSDVRHDASTRLWLLHINADKDKRLKTDTSEREIPLTHNSLRSVSSTLSTPREPTTRPASLATSSATKEASSAASRSASTATRKRMALKATSTTSSTFTRSATRCRRCSSRRAKKNMWSMLSAATARPNEARALGPTRAVPASKPNTSSS